MSDSPLIAYQHVGKRFDRGVDAAIGQTECHRRVVKRDRRRSCGLARLHALPPNVLCCGMNYSHRRDNSTDRGNRQGPRRLGGLDAV